MPRHILPLLLAAALSGPTLAQDSSPYYLGGSFGLSHVSNVYRQSTAGNSDRVLSTGLLAGLDQRFGRQRLSVDGSLQHNRYSENRGLDNQSYALRGALDWQTAGNLSGTISANSSRSLADFNIGNGIDPIFKKNTERNDEYRALARLGVFTRYTVEAGLSHRRRNFSASEYDRFVFRQNTGSLGLYAMPGGNVRLGLVGRHTKGQYPRYPIFFLGFPVSSERNDFTRTDVDFTTSWSTGGTSSLNTRISRSRTQNSLASLRDFSGTTGAIGWTWQPTAKLNLGLQYARDTGQETLARAADVNRLYRSWQLNSSYALTGKLTLNASANANRSRRTADANFTEAFDNDKSYSLGGRWAFSRGLSLGCQVNHASRDSSTPQYVYSANSYGCTGQAIVY